MGKPTNIINYVTSNMLTTCYLKKKYIPKICIIYIYIYYINKLLGKALIRGCGRIWHS